VVESGSGIVKKWFRESSGIGTLSKPRDLFSRTSVFWPYVGIMNCNKGKGLNLKRSGSSTLIVSYF